MWLSRALCVSYSPSPSSTSLHTSMYEMMRITVLTKVPSRCPSIQLAMRVMSLCSHLVRVRVRVRVRARARARARVRVRVRVRVTVLTKVPRRWPSIQLAMRLMSLCSHLGRYSGDTGEM